MLVGAHNGGVDRDVLVDLPSRIGLGLDLLEQAFPGSVGRPQAVAFVDRLPRAEPFGQVTPLNAGPHSVQNPVDQLPVIPPPATTPVADRQERPQPFPLDIRQITPPRLTTTTWTRSSHMIGRTSPSRSAHG